MNKRIISLVLFMSVLFGICAAATPFMPVSEKVAIENHLENRLTNALNSVIGEDNFIVIIDVVLNPEMKESTRERWETRTKNSQAIASGRQEMLPGIPSKAEMNRVPESSSVNKIVENMVSLPPDLVKKISAIIVIDKKVKPEQIAMVRNIAKIVLKLDEKRGDTLKTQQVELNIAKDMASKRTLSSFISIDNIIKYVSIFLAIAILVIYFLNRVSGMSAQAVSSFKESRKKDLISFPVQQQAAGGMPGVISSVQSAFAGSQENCIKKPFSFITEKDIQKLLTILPQEDSNTIADILSSLDARLSSMVISKMSGQLKDDVYARLLSHRQLEEKEIREMETRIRAKLEGTLGGSLELLAIIEHSDSEAAANILNSLEKTKPEEALVLRKQIILFGDVTKLNKTDVSKLLSRARIEDIAIIVQSSDEATKGLLLDNLPEETRSLVKEWLDLMPKQAAETVEISKKNLCLIAKALENSGEITINRS